jgi:DNA-binding NtrC family response regulator
MDRPPLSLPLEDLNLEAAERRMCIAALEVAGNIVGAAQLLGITRHALKRRMIKLDLDRPKATAAQTPRDPPGQGE